MLTPGRYVGAEDIEDDGVSFEERISGLKSALSSHFESNHLLEKRIAEALAGLE